MLIDKRRIVSLVLVIVSLILLLFVPNLSVKANWSAFRSEIEQVLDSVSMLGAWYGVDVDTGSVKMINRAVSDGTLTGIDSCVVSTQFLKLIRSVSRVVSTDEIKELHIYLLAFLLLFYATVLCGIAAAVLAAMGKKPVLSYVYAGLTTFLFLLYLWAYIKIRNDLNIKVGFVFAPLLTCLIAWAAPISTRLIGGSAKLFPVKLTVPLREGFEKAKHEVVKGSGSVAVKCRDLGRGAKEKLSGFFAGIRSNSERSPTSAGKAGLSGVFAGNKALFSGRTPQVFRYCPACGCKIGIKDRFCEHCGQKQ